MALLLLRFFAMLLPLDAAARYAAPLLLFISLDMLMLLITLLPLILLMPYACYFRFRYA